MTARVGSLPLKVVVPDGWSGQVSLVLNVHKGHPSKRVRVVKDTTHELVGQEEKTIG